MLNEYVELLGQNLQSTKQKIAELNQSCPQPSDQESKKQKEEIKKDEDDDDDNVDKKGKEADEAED